MIHVSRAEWDARPPDCAETLNKSKVTLFIVHYSGEVRSQSPRSIQNYCMDTKGHCDIDYNRIVRGDYDYMGRGWNVGGHTKDHNSISYGVCMIGLDGDVTDADKRTIRGIYDEVCAALGRTLMMTTHRNVLGENYTNCPGDQLDAWVDAGMPVEGVDDVEQTDPLLNQTGLPGRTVADVYADTENLRNAFIGAGAVALDGAGNPIPGYPKPGSPLDNMARLPQLLEKHATTAAQVDIPTLVEALRPVIAEECEKAVRRVSADASTP